MLDSNTFRMMMLVGGMMFIALIVAFSIYTPLISLSSTDQEMYRAVMNIPDNQDVSKLTIYESLHYYIQARSRSLIRNY